MPGKPSRALPQEDRGDFFQGLRESGVPVTTRELLDLIFRGYTALKSWDILRSVMYGKDFINIFVLQYTMGNLVPFILLMLPKLTIRRLFVALCLILFGVFMMRWNVVVGGQAFSLSFAGKYSSHERASMK